MFVAEDEAIVSLGVLEILTEFDYRTRFDACRHMMLKGILDKRSEIVRRIESTLRVNVISERPLIRRDGRTDHLDCPVDHVHQKSGETSDRARLFADEVPGWCLSWTRPEVSHHNQAKSAPIRIHPAVGAMPGEIRASDGLSGLTDH